MDGYVFDGHIVDEDGAEKAVAERQGNVGLLFVAHIDLRVGAHASGTLKKIMSP